MNMRRIMLTIFAIALCVQSASAQYREANVVDLPVAADVLATVRESLPGVPVRMTAELQAKDRRGDIEQTWNADIELDLAPPSARAAYTLLDRFGHTLARLVVRRSPGNDVKYTYFEGEPLEESEVPPLHESIEGMDFSWGDLALGFLWWEEGKTVGQERRKSRLCHVVDLPAPEGVDAFALVRLWIDAEVGMLLQAETYDAEGERLKKLEVKSLKKIDGHWTLQDLEVQSYPSRHKTILRVRDVDVQTNNFDSAAGM
jgi:hypothetical protein